MRPVVKGAAPRVYKTHRAARNDLTDAIGWYCSYCEMAVRNMLEIEHIIPVANGGEPLDWDNFLLSCRYCNGNKQNHNQDRLGFLWPDRDNTDLAFNYDEVNIVFPRLGSGVEAEARATINLMGLDRNSAGPNFPTAADTREQARLTAWVKAKRSLRIYQNLPSQGRAELIGMVASGAGFYSMWMVVFAGIDEVINEIVDAFTGTYSAMDAAGTRLMRSNPPHWIGSI